MADGARLETFDSDERCSLQVLIRLKLNMDAKENVHLDVQAMTSDSHEQLVGCPYDDCVPNGEGQLVVCDAGQILDQS